MRLLITFCILDVVGKRVFLYVGCMIVPYLSLTIKTYEPRSDAWRNNPF